MKKDRELLEKALLTVTSNYNYNNKIKDRIIKKLEKHNILKSKTLGMLNHSDAALITNKDLVNNAELYLLSKALYEEIEEPIINPKNYFNEEEIKSYELYKQEIKNERTNVLNFEDVKQIAYNQYFSFITIQKLSEYLDNGLITYNMRTQRGAKFITFNDQLLALPDIRETPILEIRDKILEGKFTQNMISFNIRKTGGEKFNYDSKTKELTIEIDGKDSFCDILDGMHRSIGAKRAYKMNPNIEFGFVLNIVHYTEDEAKEFIVQEDKRTPINKAVIESYKRDNAFVIIAKDINRYGNDIVNSLYNKFAIQTEEIKKGNKYTTYEIFSKALEENYVFNEPRDIKRTTEYLIDYFNELIGIFKEKGLEKSIVFHGLMFVGYIALSAKIQNMSNWRNELTNKINSIDFGDEAIWKQLGIVKGVYPQINKSLIQKISKYWREK